MGEDKEIKRIWLNDEVYEEDGELYRQTWQGTRHLCKATQETREAYADEFYQKKLRGDKR